MPLIYIVEDDDDIRGIEIYTLNAHNFEVEGFPCVKDFYLALLERLPDLIILDIMLPEEDGLSILKKLRDREDTMYTPVLMVSAKSSEFDKVTGLDLGADDYLPKPFGAMELVSRVKALLRRSQGIPNVKKELIAGNISICEKQHIASVNGTPCNLTGTEYKILHTLLQQAGEVLTRDELTEEIWGENMEYESRALDLHIGNLRKKLGIEGERIKTRRGVGFYLERE